MRRRKRVPVRRKGKRPTLRQLQRALPPRKAMSAGLHQAEDLFLEMKKRHGRRRKKITMEETLSFVVTTLGIHLSDFDYRRQPKSTRAGVARMLASLALRLADTVEVPGEKRR